MRDRRLALAFAVLAALATLAALAGCGASGRPPRLTTDMRCDACGMNLTDLSFASARRDGDVWRRYDSIECLVRDARTLPAGDAWLPDYDQASLHPADSMWVVKGSFPSPMGGGLAAFLERATADSVAAATSGRVDRFAAIAASEVSK